VCQNDWKKEPTLAAVSTGGARSSGLCAGACLTIVPWCLLEEGSARKGPGALCAVVLRTRDPPESVVCERRCKASFG
jgi:hypothetical protein